jgi:peptide-methionine (R)-S-oxide reductase
MAGRRMVLGGSLGGLLAGLGVVRGGWAQAGDDGRQQSFEVTRTDEAWRRILAPNQFAILRRHGTEPPGSSPLDHEFGKGVYACAGCALPLFASDAKFDSGTGWPSFWQPLDNAVSTTEDTSLFMRRTEAHCRRCGGHLGHVFDDGPRPTGLRYCMNGTALTFQAA